MWKPQRTKSNQVYDLTQIMIEETKWRKKIVGKIEISKLERTDVCHKQNKHWLDTSIIIKESVTQITQWVQAHILTKWQLSSPHKTFKYSKAKWEMHYTISEQKMIMIAQRSNYSNKRSAMLNFLASDLAGITDHAIIDIGTKI